MLKKGSMKLMSFVSKFVPRAIVDDPSVIAWKKIEILPTIE